MVYSEGNYAFRHAGIVKAMVYKKTYRSCAPDIIFVMPASKLYEP